MFVVVFLSVCIVCMYMYPHLSGYISSIAYMIKKLHQKTNNLQLLAHLHQAKIIILAGIFEKSSRNPKEGLELIICILWLKLTD